jgi:nitrogen fixation protein FixH
VTAAQAQDTLHWSVEADLQHGETKSIAILARDAQARPLSGLVAEAVLAHPTDKRRDVAVTFVEMAPGQFKSLTPLPEGRWDLVIDLKRGDNVVFRSKSRISL